jgi:hypothetical protein
VRVRPHRRNRTRHSLRVKRAPGASSTSIRAWRAAPQARGAQLSGAAWARAPSSIAALPHAHCCVERRRLQDDHARPSSHRDVVNRSSSMLFAALNLPEVTSNGEVEGPHDHAGRAQLERSSSIVPHAAGQRRRGRTISQRPRRQLESASRTPPTIVRCQGWLASVESSLA